MDAIVEIGDDELGWSRAHGRVSSDGSVSQRVAILVQIMVPLAVRSTMLQVE